MPQDRECSILQWRWLDRRRRHPTHYAQRAVIALRRSFGECEALLAAKGLLLLRKYNPYQYVNNQHDGDMPAAKVRVVNLDDRKLLVSRYHRHVFLRQVHRQE